MTDLPPDSDIPWPSADMALLGGSHPPSFDGANACFQLTPNWTAYRAAYEEAVALIAPEASRANDYMIFPMLFCGRQALELGLKEMLQILYSLQGQEPRYPATHRLDVLWQQVRAQISAVSLRLDPSTEHFERLLSEFDQLDPVSDRFRYPEDRHGQPSHDPLDQELPKIVDVANVHHSLQAMFNYIDCGCDYFEAGAERRRDR